MGFTYLGRFDGRGDRCKIGKATTLASRMSTLQTGSADNLELFDYVESEHALKGEQFLKRRWAHRLHRYRSEVYRLTEDECRQAMAELRQYLEHVLPTELAEQQQLAELEVVDNDDTMIEPDPEILAAHRRLVEIESERRRLDYEAETLRRSIILAIGKNKGIEGVATCDRADSNRTFDVERFQAEHPQLYQEFLKPRFDTTGFSKKHRDLAEAYKEPGKKRTFFLIEDLGAAE